MGPFTSALAYTQRKRRLERRLAPGSMLVDLVPQRART